MLLWITICYRVNFLCDCCYFICTMYHQSYHKQLCFQCFILFSLSIQVLTLRWLRCLMFLLTIHQDPRNKTQSNEADGTNLDIEMFLHHYTKYWVTIATILSDDLWWWHDHNLWWWRDSRPGCSSKWDNT